MKSTLSPGAPHLRGWIARTGRVAIAAFPGLALALTCALAADSPPRPPVLRTVAGKPAPHAEVEPRGTPRPPALRTFEARGAGRPLWRRWVDLDGDGKLDLVVVTGSSSAAGIPDEGRVEDLIAYLHVTPSFLDQRQVLIYRQRADRFEPWGEPLPLTGDTAAVDVADLDGDGRPEILYTAGYSIYAFARGAQDTAYPAQARSLGTSEMLLGFTRSFIPGARLAGEIVKGKPPSLILATANGLEIRNLGADGLLPPAPAFALRNGFRSVSRQGGGTWLWDPRPRIVDMDGDGTSDFLFQKSEHIVIYKGRGDGTFDVPPMIVDQGEGSRNSPMRRGRSRGGNVPRLEDVDGDGLLDLVRLPSMDTSGGGDGSDAPEDGTSEDGSGPDQAEEPEPPRDTKAAKNMKAAGDTRAAKDTRAARDTRAGNSRPLARAEIRLARSGPSFPSAPDRIVEINRNQKREEATIDFLKIDDDAREDLLVTRIAVSLWQIPRALISKKISIQVSFETMLQRADGSFAPSLGKPFETKVMIDLKRGISGLPTAPRGDFNGDGIVDLLEFSSAPEIKIHTTTSDGVFPKDAAWTGPLPREPEDRELMDVLDIDGDGRSDVAYFNLEGAGFVATIMRSGP